jgi:DNA-binding transcriptional ArsR family regulator
MKAVDYKKIAGFCGAIAHPVRIEIVAELLKNKKCVTDIKELLDVKQPNVSQHLYVLKAQGIVDWYQDRKKKCYFLNDPKLMKDILNVLKKYKGHYI